MSYELVMGALAIAALGVGAAAALWSIVNIAWTASRIYKQEVEHLRGLNGRRKDEQCSRP